MVSDGAHYSEYDSAMTGLLIGEAAGLMRALGFASRHMALIGGVVPGLLVPILDPGIEPHVGTTDLDFCLSVALVEGDTAEYEKIERCLATAGFKAEESWRWRGGADGRIIVEFFCPVGPGRVPGKLFRPSGEGLSRARRNLGSKFSAMVLSVGDLMSRDIQEVRREVSLPKGKGRATVSLRVTGPTAFLAAKAAALRERNKSKDSYDIIWLLDAWPQGPTELARTVSRSGFFSEPIVEETLVTLEDHFGNADRAGAIAYARFLSGSGEEPDRLVLHAVGAVREFLRAVR